MNSCLLHPEMQTGACLLITLSVLLTELFVATETEAAVLGQLSLAAVEEYTDNVRFSDKSTGDFVTTVAPTLRLIYKPFGYTDPSFTANLFAPIEIFARNSRLNNIGKNIRFNTEYLYPYSPRLDFTLRESLERRGVTRTAGSNGLLGDGGVGSGSGSGVVGIPIPGVGGGGFPGSSGAGGGGACGRVGSISSRRQTQNGSPFSFSEGDLITRGQWLENQTGVSGQYLVTPRLSIRAGYCWDYVEFIDAGGKETAHSMNVEARYQIREQTQIRVGYGISLVRSRDGREDLIHDIDIGGDYLQLKEIRLTPTLILSGSTGIALATRNNGAQGGSGSSSDKFRIEHTLNVRLTKLWQDGSTTLGVERGLTGSFGAGGPSFTTRFFLASVISLAKNVNGTSDVGYSQYDTGDNNFDTFQATVALQYLTTLGFSVGIGYSYQQFQGNKNSQSSFDFGRSSFEGNSFFLFISTEFDVWPSIGLTRSQSP
jgi:hypothetical protein